MDPQMPAPPRTGLNVSPPAVTPKPPEPNLSFLQPHKDRNIGKIVLWVSVGIVMLLIIAIGVVVFMQHNKHAAAPARQASTANGTTPSHNTDNATLDKDITSLQQSINSGDKDQTASNSGVNDADIQVQVPTN